MAYCIINTEKFSYLTEKNIWLKYKENHSALKDIYVNQM